MERLYQRAAAEHRRTRIPELRQTPYDDPSPSDTTTARLNVEGITDELKKSFWTIYKKHGSLKERRDFKTVVNNVSREASLARYELQPFNVENALRISEQQYKVLLAWYKKTVEDDLLRPLRETLHLEVTKVELSSPSSSDEMESPNPDRFLNQDIPLRGPGVVISQAYMNESASHELDGVPVHLDNRNTSGNRTRLPPPSKLASNPYPIHMCSLLILLATKSSSGNEKTLRISSQPIVIYLRFCINSLPRIVCPLLVLYTGSRLQIVEISRMIPQTARLHATYQKLNLMALQAPTQTYQVRVEKS
ncbi:hypothetical protein F5880DRAFT_1615500 [Lentinula raphanica]|nr:hypothetical protein F5880DRAFT_1615500 [Lentinula raphanica]